MIKPNQITAARALLDWKREDLAKQADMHHDTIRNIETGVTENPRSNTIKPIIEAFERNGIEFIDGGVREIQNKIRILEGKDSYAKLMDEAYHIVRNSKKDKEILFSNVDQTLSKGATIEAQKRMMNAGIQLRFTVCEGDTNLLYPLKFYRYIPKEDFLNALVVIFGDYFAISVRTERKITIINDAVVAEAFRRQYKKLWHFYKEPKALE